jgi:hypothetical protein
MFWLPASSLFIAYLVQYGAQRPDDLPDFCFTVLWTSVGLLGVGSLFWHVLFGMKRQRLLHLWPVLVWLPLYYCLHTIAVWTALYQLFWRPFHWDKTEHGLAGKASAERAARVLSRMPQ